MTVDTQSKLTDAGFWDAYWRSCRVPVEVDVGFSFDRCVARELKTILRGRTGSVLEVGCAPGKWLVFLSRQMGLVPSGIEYSDVGISKTRQNFDLLKVAYGKLYCGDFFAMQPRPEHDVVMSLGFIEHFDDPMVVVNRHVEWLRPGGLLVLGVPNFRGIYGPMQRVLDSAILASHNTKVMSIDYLEGIARHFNLSVEYLKYIGGLEPALPISRAGFANASQFIVKSAIKTLRGIRRFRVFDHINHRFISSYLLMACRKGL